MPEGWLKQYSDATSTIDDPEDIRRKQMLTISNKQRHWLKNEKMAP